MKRLLLSFFLFLILIAIYLLAWPVDVKPVHWEAPPAPAMEGPYAPNERLATAKTFNPAPHGSFGPEGVAIRADGLVYSGWVDGRITRSHADTNKVEQLFNTKGRPLGLALDADGQLWIADAIKGLLRWDGTQLHTMLTAADGVDFKFVDDVDVAGDGKVYFSDASSRWGWGDSLKDVVEHQGNGRLIQYDPFTDRTKVLLDGLQFANGIAVGPGDRFVLVNETGSYRVIRYWLKGHQKGEHDVFIDNLPGFPDNISFNGKDRFWLALYAPRNAQLDAIANRPWLRKMLFRLPAALRPQPQHMSFVLGLDIQGRVQDNLQAHGPSAYGPITSAKQHGSRLYLGSLTATTQAYWDMQ